MKWNAWIVASSACLIFAAVPFVLEAQTPTLVLSWVTYTSNPETGEMLRAVHMQIEDGGTYALGMGVERGFDISIDGIWSPITSGNVYRIVNGTRVPAGYIGPPLNSMIFTELGAYEVDVYDMPLPQLAFETKSPLRRLFAFFVGEIAHAQVIEIPAWEYVGTIHFTIAPTVEECCSSVMFLPGLQASRLYMWSAFGDHEEKLWEPRPLFDEASYLRLGGTGTDIYTRNGDTNGGIIDSVLGSDIYGSFLSTLNGLKQNGDITDYQAVGYDWRLDYDDLLTRGAQNESGFVFWRGTKAATTTPYIIQQVRALAAESQTGKVTIVAHSNGGLLAKALTNALGAEASTLIDKIIFVGVPQLGTPKTIGALLNGTDQGYPFLFSSADGRAVGQTMPSAFNLLPSARYLDSDTDPVVTFSTSTLPEWAERYGEIDTWAELRRFMTDAWRPDPVYGDVDTPDIVDAAMMDKANTGHRKLDNWTLPQGVEFITIAGWGLPTLASFEYARVSRCIFASGAHCIARGTGISLSPKHVIDGDGTVVVPSAMAGSGHEYWFNLRRYNADNSSDFRHSSIMVPPEVRGLIEEMITDRPLSRSVYVSTTVPSFSGEANRMEFEVHSPVSLYFVDQNGNKVGLQSDGTTAGDITGVYFEQYGDVKWLSVPKGLVGKIVMEGMDSGSFTLIVTESDGTNVTKVAQYSAIPVDTNTEATLPIDSSGPSASLGVDTDGDGDIDQDVSQDVPTVVTIESLKTDIRLARSLGWITSDAYMNSLIQRIDPPVVKKSITIGRGKLKVGTGVVPVELQRSAEISRVRTLLSEIERGKLSGRLSESGRAFLFASASKFISELTI